MRTVIRVIPGQSRRRSQEAGITAHDNINLNSTQGAVVEIITLERGGHKLSGAAETGCMIVFAQIIVDCLGNMKAVNVTPRLHSLFIDDMRGFS